MNTYLWSISQLDCKPTVDQLTDYVVTSHYRCTGTDGTFSGQCYATVNFEVNPDKPNYVPFAEITEQMAIEWTQEALGEEQVAAIYTSIDSQIEDQHHPKIISPALPWASQPTNEAIV